MTIQDAISEFNMYSPNTLDEAIKYKWLSNAERIVKTVLSTYEGQDFSITEISPDSDKRLELVAQEPYSELYKYYMLAQINLLYGDTVKYNVFASLYESELESFRLWCVQNLKSKNINAQFEVI